MNDDLHWLTKQNEKWQRDALSRFVAVGVGIISLVIYLLGK
jgi:hypothetical protein